MENLNNSQALAALPRRTKIYAASIIFLIASVALGNITGYKFGKRFKFSVGF